MASDLFQHPKIFVVIAVNDEVIDRLRTEFEKKPLVEVYILSPSFFLQPEFVYNPLWSRDLSRIIWVLQGEQSVLEVAAITRFLTRWQEITTILGFSFSPPPLANSVTLRKALSNWKSRVELDDDLKTRVMLNLPKVSLVIGQDVLLDSWTQKTPLMEILNLTAANSLPTLNGLNFYWQSLDQFLAAAWEKMFNPLIGMRFWLCGKKISGKKMGVLLGEIWESKTGNKWALLPGVEIGERELRKGADESPFFSQQIFVKQEEGKIEEKWALYLKLVMKRKQTGELEKIIRAENEQEILEEMEKEVQKVVNKVAKLFPETSAFGGSANLFERRGVQNVLKQLDQTVMNAEKVESKEETFFLEDAKGNEHESYQWQQKTSLRAKIRPLGGGDSNAQKAALDPEKMIVLPEREKGEVVLREQPGMKVERSSLALKVSGRWREEKVATNLARSEDFIPRGVALLSQSGEEKKTVDLIKDERQEKSEMKKIKSRLVETVEPKTKKKMSLDEGKIREEKGEVKKFSSEEKKTGSKKKDVRIEEIEKKKEQIKDQRREELSAKIDLDKYESVREKLLAAGKISPTSPLSEADMKISRVGKVEKRENKKTKKRFLILVCFLTSGLIALSGGLWLVWQRSEKDYYLRVSQLLNVCSSQEGCDWSQENEKIQLSSKNFKRQLSLYQTILPLTKQSEFSDWEKLVEQMKKYQENQNQVNLNWEEVYFSVTNRKNNFDSPLLWQNQENLIWQNDQLILNMLSMLSQIQANKWLSNVNLDKVQTQLKQEQSKNHNLYQQTGFWRQVLGQKGEKNYAILFFNSEQIRPGGGVVEAVLDVQIRDGQVKKVTPYSAAGLNAKLNPKPLVTDRISGYLGRKSGSLMDVGFDGDFEVAANKAQWYLGRTIGKEFDGIIGINSRLVKDSVFGYEELVLRQSGEKVNQGNYLSWVQSKTKMAVENQERGKALTDLFTSFMQKQMLLSKEEVSGLALKLGSGVKKGWIEAWFKEEALQDRTKQLGISGSILVPECAKLFNTSNCQGDSLHVYVTDLTGSSQKEMPKMKWEEETLLLNDEVKRQAVLEWGSDAERLGGKYYLQLYLPQKAQKKLILVDGVQTMLDDENGLLIDFGGKNKKRIELSYVLSRDKNDAVGEEGYVYTYLQHIPVGLENVETSLKVKSELGKPYKFISPVPTQEDMTLNFKGSPDEDMFITVGF